MPRSWSSMRFATCRALPRLKSPLYAGDLIEAPASPCTVLQTSDKKTICRATLVSRLLSTFSPHCATRPAFPPLHHLVSPPLDAHAVLFVAVCPRHAASEAAKMSGSMGTDARITEHDLGAVMRNSEEWALIEYMLQINARTSRLRLLQGWHLAPPAVVSRFERRTTGRLIMTAFIDTTKLDEENAIQDVCRRGFKVGPKGLKLSVGNFSLPGFPLIKGGSINSGDPLMLRSAMVGEDEGGSEIKQVQRALNIAKHETLSGERRVHEFFLCDVGIGHSVVVGDEKEASGDRFTLPLEYDSAYLQDTSVAPAESLTIHYEDKALLIPEQRFRDDPTTTSTYSSGIAGEVASAGVLPQYTFRHEYIVYDSSQVLPRYLLQVECDPSAREDFAVPLCDNCHDMGAAIWCPSDCARLCSMCDDRLHSFNKLVSRHIRVPLNEMPRPFGMCHHHPDDVYELFCVVCSVPVCRLCRPNHAHTDVSGRTLRSNALDSRTLIGLRKAYTAALQDGEKPHYVLEARRLAINAELENLQKIFDEVRCNAREAEQRCYAILEGATQQLQERTESKMSVVLGDQLEAQRQLNAMEWSESFLKYLKSVLPPADYLMAWLKHCRLRDDLEAATCGAGDLLKDAFPDLRLTGRVDILTDSAMRHRQQHHHDESKDKR